MTQVHHEWLAKWQREVEDDYARLHKKAKRDPQSAGHGGESTWLRLLEEWLPPAYEVGTRKYIVPEVGNDSFETDLVIFNPGYPRRLRQREEILAGGVAAAFSVKLTLDAAGLKDAVDRGARLRRSMKPRIGSPRSELLGAFAFGLLCHSHTWKQSGSTPRENLQESLWRLDSEIVQHPRESLDFACIADLTAVDTLRIPYMPPHHLQHLTKQGIDVGSGQAITAMTMADESATPGPVSVLVAALIERLSQTDPALRPFADGLRLTDTFGSGAGWQRFYPLADVYSEQVIIQLPSRAFADDGWGSALW